MNTPATEDEDARARRVLVITALGALANAAWLFVSVRAPDPLAVALSAIGLVICAVPALLCARRLARRGS